MFRKLAIIALATPLLLATVTPAFAAGELVLTFETSDTSYLHIDFDDKPMVHAHIMFSDMEGKACGGHLMAGTRVFSLEVFIQELTGDLKVRKLEKVTQLPLWTNPLCFK